MKKIKLTFGCPAPARRLFMCSAAALLLSAHGVTADAAAVSVDKAGRWQVASLLSSARGALAAGRLSVPVDRSAVSYAQRVLDLTPDHPEALAILQQVVNRYEVLSRNRLDKGESALLAQVREARRLQQRGLLVSERHGLRADSLRQMDTVVRRTEGHGPAADGHDVQSTAEAAARMAESYLTRGESALRAGDRIGARRYLAVAKQVVVDYGIKFSKSPSPTALDTRLQSAIAAAWNTGKPADENANESTVLWAPKLPTLADQWPSVFIPPAF